MSRKTPGGPLEPSRSRWEGRRPPSPSGIVPGALATTLGRELLCINLQGEGQAVGAATVESARRHSDPRSLGTSFLPRPEAVNAAKRALRSGGVDVRTLSPTFLPDPGVDRFARLALAHNPRTARDRQRLPSSARQGRPRARRTPFGPAPRRGRPGQAADAARVRPARATAPTRAQATAGSCAVTARRTFHGAARPLPHACGMLRHADGPRRATAGAVGFVAGVARVRHVAGTPDRRRAREVSDAARLRPAHRRATAAGDNARRCRRRAACGGTAASQAPRACPEKNSNPDPSGPVRSGATRTRSRGGS
jgi:hypothetical protein